MSDTPLSRTEQRLLTYEAALNERGDPFALSDTERFMLIGLDQARSLRRIAAALESETESARAAAYAERLRRDFHP